MRTGASGRTKRERAPARSRTWRRRRPGPPRDARSPRSRICCPRPPVHRPGGLRNGARVPDRAAAINPANPGAVALHKSASDALARLGPNASEKTRIDLYKVKERGTAALKRNDPVSAYYILKHGTEIHTEDAELLELLAAAKAALEPLAFFRDTIPDRDLVPKRDKVQRVAFVNRKEPGLVEIVYADSVVRVPRTIVETLTRADGSQYSARRELAEVTLYDIEVMAFGGGRIVHHLRADVGRLMSQPGAGSAKKGFERLVPSTSTDVALARIALLALDRSVEKNRLAPAFVVGKELGFARFGLPAGAQPSPAGASTLPLVAPPDSVWTASLELSNVRERDIVELWTLWRARPAIDVRVERRCCARFGPSSC